MVATSIVSIAYGCSSSSSGGAAAGTEGAACYANSTCNAGLSCLSNLCVNAGADGGMDSGSDLGTTDANRDTAVSPDVLVDGPADGGMPPYTLWLRADKGVTTDAVGVTGWADQSPSAVSFTPVNACNTAGHPQFIASAINGLPAVDLAPGGAVCSLTGTAPSLAVKNGPVLVEIVVSNTTTSFANLAYWQWGSTFGISFQTAGPRHASIHGPLADGGVNQTVGALDISGVAPHLIGFYRDGAGLVTLRVDGNPDGTPTILDGSFDFPAVVNITAAHFAEVIMIDAALTPAQVTSIEASLKTKYGL